MRRISRFPQRCVAVSCVLLSIPVLLTTEVQAQTASALVREGDNLGTVGTVNSINNPSVNQVGGFSVQLNTNNGTTTLSNIWGNATGGSGAILLTENTYGNWMQTAFESFNGLNDRGEACYGVTATNLDTGVTGLDGVFMDQTPILMGREPVPTIPGFYSTFNSRPGCTSVDPYWVGGITNVPNSSTSQNRVLFFGFQATPILRGGDNIGGINVPHVTGGMDFDVRFSRLGTHWVLDAQVTGSTANDRVMTLDGSALVAGGGFVREGLPIPAAVGGVAGENWANFDFMGVTELGRVFFTGDSSAATTMDEAVIDNGQIVLREGTVFAGPGGNYTISGDIEGGYQNRQGDWAVIWDANGPNAVNREILLVNGTMVLQETDAVDLSGDGVPEPTSKLADFTGISSLVIGPRDASGNVTLYFTADVDVNGTPTSSDDVEALLRLTVPSGVANQLPVASCQDVTVPAGAGCVAEANVDDGSADPDDDPLTLGQSPAGPYPVGTTEVTLTVTDIQGATDTCTAQVTVTTACDDGNPCTADSCNPDGGCTNEPISCDDGNACTADSCDPASGCVSEPISCDDGNACTSDSCDPASGCVSEEVVCDDGDACTADSCDPADGCHNDTIVCDDENACTADGCDPASGCTATPIPADDGNACTADSCDPITGAHYEPIVCDDGDGCTADSCDPATGCVFDPVSAAEPNPRTTGYWKRLCQGPHSGDELVDADAACVASQGATFAGMATVADLCAVLLQGGQGGTCEHTEIDLVSLALNTCHLRVCGGNAIQSQYGENATVGESYDEADGILSDPDRNQQSCLDAKGLLEEINTGRALHLDTTAFDKVGAGVRVTWEVPYGMTPVKYNVWRRRAGSLDAFVKIGETTTPVFDDGTPGSFEYDVTPVR